MKEYIVNLTNNLIGSNGFDGMFRTMKAEQGTDLEAVDGWKEEFVRLVNLALSSNEVQRMSPETLGKIVCSIDGNEFPCYSPAHYFGQPEQYLRNIVSSFLAWSIRYRLDEGACKRHSKMPPYPPKPRNTEADYSPLSGRFGP